MRFSHVVIARPKAALCVFFGIGFVLYAYGVRDGVLLLVALVLGISFYKLLAHY